MIENIDNTINKIHQEYETMILSRKQVAKILNKSTTTIDRWRKKGLYLEYSKVGEAKNATIEYTLNEVAKYIISNKIKVV